VVFLTAEEIPLTATGKAQKFRLAELAKQRLSLGNPVGPGLGDASRMNPPKP